MRLVILSVVAASALVLSGCDNSSTNDQAVAPAPKAQPAADTVAQAAPADAAPAAVEGGMGMGMGMGSPEPRREEARGLGFPMTPLIDPNSATADEIAAIPGMTPEAAQIIAASGPYDTPTQLHAVLTDILDEKTLHNVYREMFIKVSLNNGSEDDYKLIPSTLPPRKLAHEFEEYRPYESLDQFTTEMAKYMTQEEAVYLQRYVIVD